MIEGAGSCPTSQEYQVHARVHDASTHTVEEARHARMHARNMQVPCMQARGRANLHYNDSGKRDGWRADEGLCWLPGLSRVSSVYQISRARHPSSRSSPPHEAISNQQNPPDTTAP